RGAPRWLYRRAVPSLRSQLGFGADGRGDVVAHLGDGLAVGGGERVKTLSLHGLACDGAARADLSAGGLADGPYRLERGGLSLDRLEALYVDRDPVVGVEVGELRGGDVRGA